MDETPTTGTNINEEQTVEWFGASWGAPICRDTKHVPTPVGKLCARCGEPIRPNDCGLVIPFVGGPNDPVRLPWHRACFFRDLGIDRGFQA